MPKIGDRFSKWHDEKKEFVEKWDRFVGREILKPGLVNIIGKVLTISEIYRVKKDVLFTIQMSHSVFIIVKKSEYLYWQKILAPHNEYVITELRATTLTKGAGKSLKVFVPWTKSRIFMASVCNYTTLGIKEWLRHGSGNLEVLESLKSGPEPEENQIPQVLGSYQGQVTSDELAVLGFYTLDHSVGLYASCVPALDTFHTIRVGSVLAVHNAHIYKSKHLPNIRIICCMSSCIKVKEFSPCNVQPKVLGHSSALQLMLWKYGLQRSDVNLLVDMIQALTDKFKLLLDAREVCKLVDALMTCRLITVSNTTIRNYLQEITSTNHSCCFLNSTQEQNVKLTFPYFKKLIDILSDRISTTLSSGTDQMAVHKSSVHLDNWDYTVQAVDSNQEKILVGILELCPLSGRVKLSDGTGSISCVITSRRKGETTSLLRDCNLQCCCDDLEPGSKFKCAYFHTCCQGSVVAITRYCLVQEDFQLGKQSSFLSRNHKSYIYLQFSMEDSFLLSRRIDESFANQFCNKEPKKQKLSDENNTHRRDAGNSQNILICRCEGLLYEKKKDDSGLRACAVGYIIPNNLEERDLSDFVEKLCTKMDRQTTCDSTVPCNANSATGECSSQNENMDCLSNGGGNAAKSIPSVIFLFSGKSARWYPALSPGSLYNVVIPNNGNKLRQPSTASWQLRKAVSKAGGRGCIVIPENAELRRIFLHRTPSKKYEHLITLMEVQADGCREELVSMICHVVTREDKALYDPGAKNRKYGDEAAEMGSVKLCVGCPDIQGSLDVYYNTEGGPFPLGLIPGTVVHFQNLERKVSRTGKVYCQFLSVSSFHILQFSDGQASKSKDLSLVQPVQVMESQRTPMYLSQLWTQLVDRGHTFQSICWIQKIVKVSLKYLCQKCGTTIIGGTCSNRSCDSGSEDITFLSRASFIAEDGTSVAMVSCRDTVVQTILLLSDKEWTSLKEMVQSSQEVFVQQTYPADGSCLEKFVYMVCDNPQIKRDWLLTLSTGRSAPPINLSTLPVDEFVTKSVDTGLGVVQTKCLPFIYLDCLAITEVDFIQSTVNMLSQ